MLHRFALETALRASTLRGLTVGDFDLDTDEPGVTLRGAKGTKERGRRTLPLMADTAATLREQFAAKLPPAPAFNIPLLDRPADLLRDDLQVPWAEWIAEAPRPSNATSGRRAVSSQPRMSRAGGWTSTPSATPRRRGDAATRLAKRGVPLTVVMLVTGHKNVSTLQNHYLRHGADDVRQALRRNHDPEPAKATGTAAATAHRDDNHEPKGGNGAGETATVSVWYRICHQHLVTR